MGSLKDYKKKRSLDKTPEPSGKEKSKSNKARKEKIFIINKHDASRLHYDLRIEIDGVLKSWSVPKGPSTNPEQKRLAIPTEDHPLEYADFEGVIPEGNYGAGTVIIWEKGTYRNIKEDISMKDSFRKGKIEIELNGKKLKGKYALIRTRGSKDSKDRQWLFFKMKDKYADSRRNPISTEPESVVSGRTIEQVRESQ